MKKTLVLFLFISSLSYAQYTIKGTMTSIENSYWVLLYKIEGAKEVFIKNTQVKKNGKIGFFELSLPNETKAGSYRIKYSIRKDGFIDFLFNKENIEFEFNFKDPENTIIFKKSKENQIYNSFVKEIYNAQYTLDSIQSEYFRNPSSLSKETYKISLSKIKKIEEKYTQVSQGKLVNHFIKATLRYNSPEISERPREYISSSSNHFFDHVDFSNNILYNSSFLFEKISEYIFYLNYSNDPIQKQEFYKKASQVAIGKIKTISFKADVINYLISQFGAIKNAEIVDHLFANYFDKLPKENQDIRFKNKILSQLRIAIGRDAPDFSWTENGQELRLSTLKDGLNYLLIFYSTECSHCLKEVPEVFEYLKDKTNTKVIAFAMETSENTWLNYQLKMPGWHHVLGLNKWENTIARTYQVNSTPSYFVLGMDKQIISIPKKIADLKLVLKELN